jgi:hypothetical protein
MMMMSFICSCRNKNQHKSIYPKGTSHHTIKIGADVWGESSIRQEFINAGAHLLCTSDGVCVIVYVKFSSVGACTVWGGGVFSSFWD